MNSIPIRIQLSRAKGWRMPANTVKVDRTTRWGNPYEQHGNGTAIKPAVAVGLFRKLLQDHGAFVSYMGGRKFTTTRLADVRRDLRGKNLACWCRPGIPCHADVLLQLANEELSAAGIPPFTNNSLKVLA